LRCVSMVLIAVTLCSSARADTLSEKQKAAIKEAIGDKLVDPYSAKYTFEIVHLTKSGIVKVCGTVNVKNKMGGYSGKSPYAVAILHDKVALSEVFDDVTLDFIRNRSVCAAE
jgi:hypothetical protein